jgi:hypothetical protein
VGEDVVIKRVIRDVKRLPNNRLRYYCEAAFSPYMEMYTCKDRYPGIVTPHRMLPKWFPKKLTGCVNIPTRIDISQLSVVTQENLESVSTIIRWGDHAFAFPVKQNRGSLAYTFAVLGTGVVGDSQVLFLRYESKSVAAGQTYLYIKKPGLNVRSFKFTVLKERLQLLKAVVVGDKVLLDVVLGVISLEELAGPTGPNTD